MVRGTRLVEYLLILLVTFLRRDKRRRYTILVNPVSGCQRKISVRLIGVNGWGVEGETERKMDRDREVDKTQRETEEREKDRNLPKRQAKRVTRGERKRTFIDHLHLLDLINMDRLSRGRNLTHKV